MIRPGGVNSFFFDPFIFLSHGSGFLSHGTGRGDAAPGLAAVHSL
jgi:hypothetical protein